MNNCEAILLKCKSPVPYTYQWYSERDFILIYS